MTAPRGPARPVVNRKAKPVGGRRIIRQSGDGGVPAYTVPSRGGCFLDVPPALLDARSGTMTLDEYRAWSES